MFAVLSSVQTRVLLESVIVVVVSLLFWIWAFVITLSGNYDNGLILHKSYDDGLVCFTCTFATGVCGVLFSRNVLYQKSILFGRMIIITFAITVIIFTAAAIFTDPSEMHLAYLIVSGFLWIVYGTMYYYDVVIIA